MKALTFHVRTCSRLKHSKLAFLLTLSLRRACIYTTIDSSHYFNGRRWCRMIQRNRRAFSDREFTDRAFSNRTHTDLTTRFRTLFGVASKRVGCQTGRPPRNLHYRTRPDNRLVNGSFHTGGPYFASEQDLNADYAENEQYKAVNNHGKGRGQL